MSYLLNNQQKMNEIVFQNKNRSYGAYAIRSVYGNTVVKSVSIMSLGMGIFLSLAFYLTRQKEMITNEQIIPICRITPVEIIPEAPKTDKPKANELPKSNPGGGNKNTLSTTIADSASVNTNTVMNDNQTVTTNSSTGTGTTAVETSTLTGTGNGTLSGGGNTEVHVVADSSPEFEGGLKGLYTYLANNLKFPQEAREAGADGTVHVRFIVDENGKVSSPTALNNVGFGLSAEAIRVVSSIPNFKKPGMMKGVPVKVYFTLPIKFKYQ